jgi:hypothetical protein
MGRASRRESFFDNCRRRDCGIFDKIGAFPQENNADA